MKKGLVLLIAAGAFLVSLSGKGEREKRAAREFCVCHSELAKLSKDLKKIDSVFNVNIEEVKTIADRAIRCHESWLRHHDGELDLDLFKEELKKRNKEVYDMAINDGLIFE